MTGWGGRDLLSIALILKLLKLQEPESIQFCRPSFSSGESLDRFFGAESLLLGPSSRAERKFDPVISKESFDRDFDLSFIGPRPFAESPTDLSCS